MCIGDQAEIVFTLIGEPPFTFTYQRSEPSPRKGGKPGKILETHTVSGVTTHEYSVFSALEGSSQSTNLDLRTEVDLQALGRLPPLLTAIADTPPCKTVWVKNLDLRNVMSSVMSFIL